MGVVVFTTIDLRRLSSQHVHGRCNVCHLVKNEFDPLWYGRLGLGMTRRVVNIQQVVYYNKDMVKKLMFWRWFMKHLSNTGKKNLYWKWSDL
jgi:hypothetical protein